MSNRSRSVRRRKVGGVCASERIHEHDLFLFLGAVSMGTWRNVRQINEAWCPFGHHHLWRVLSCGCAVATPCQEVDL